MGRSKLDDGNCDINSKLGDGVCNDTEDCSGWLRILVPRMSVLDSGSTPGTLVIMYCTSYEKHSTASWVESGNLNCTLVAKLFSPENLRVTYLLLTLSLACLSR